MIWLTGDHHFRHFNIIKYCNRPFESIEEHDQTLIDAWNKCVMDGDTVYYLGDFTLGNVQAVREIVPFLKGKIRLLTNEWHHDGRWLSDWDDIYPAIYFEEALIVLDDKKKFPVPIVLCHYPFEVWDRKHYGAIHFHGHSHGELHRIHNRLDVGVDMAYKLLGSYRPFSMHEALSFATGYYEEGRHGNLSDET